MRLAQLFKWMIYLWDMSKNVNNRTGTFPNLYSNDVDNGPLAQILGSSFLARSVSARSLRLFFAIISHPEREIFCNGKNALCKIAKRIPGFPPIKHKP